MTIIITDLDGVFLERYRKKSGEDFELWTEFFSTIKNLKIEKLIFLTDRSAVQLLPLAYIFKGDRFHGGESGAVVCDRDSNTTIINPRFNEIGELRNKILKTLNSCSDDGIPWEPGCEVAIRIERIMPEEKENKLWEEMQKQAVKFPEFEAEKHNSTLVLKPKDFSKADGLNFLFSLYPASPNWESILYIGDSKMDIPVAKLISQKGGTTSAVGNAEESYKDIVRINDGIITPYSNLRGVIDILRQWKKRVI